MKDFGNNHDQEQAGFGMPKDYFPASADALKNRMEWLEEHREFPALKMAWRKNLFIVPESYFERSATNLENTPYQSLQQLKGKWPFTAPVNYFGQEFSDQVKTLASLSKEQAFAVPDQYFEASSKKIYSALEETKSAKVISLKGRLRTWQFAAAAVLILSATWFTYQYYMTPVIAPDCGGIACVDRREILQTKSLELLDEDELQTIVNAKHLEESLNRAETKPSDKNDTAISEEDLLDNL